MSGGSCRALTSRQENGKLSWPPLRHRSKTKTKSQNLVKIIKFLFKRNSGFFKISVRIHKLMAENSDTASPSKSSAGTEGGWFNSWLNAAKNKSTEVLEFVKKDLEEFGTAVKNEASSVVTSAGSVMEKTLSLESPDSTVNTVKRSFSTFLGQMNTVLNPSPDDEDTEILIVENSETHKLNKFQKALYELQKDSETYLCDPEPHLSKQYSCWLEILEPEQLSDDRIAKHVNSSELLKKHYAKLVPDILEHQLFWKRYLFKKALLEDEIAKQEILERRDQKEKEQVVLHEELQEGENLKWEHADFAADVELTEEEQIALLEEYEKEQKKRSITPKKPQNNTTTAATQSTTTADIEEVTTKEPIQGQADKVDSAVSLGTPGSSNCSTDDDWEKISDVDK